MRDYIIMADAACELAEAVSEEYEIKIVPGHLVFPGGKELRTFMNWEEYSREEFYADLKKSPSSYATSPANPQEYAEAFEKYVSQGYDILIITLSSGISGSYNNAQTGAKMVLENHPEASICCIDSLRFGAACGLMCINAALLRRKGLSLMQTAAYTEDNKNRYHQAGWLDDLSFVAKKGRITHAKAFFGTLVGVKPIGEFDYNGLTTVIGKAKGANAAYSALLDYIGETIENPEEQIIFVAHTNRLPQAEAYKKMIEERFHPKAVYINDVFPCCGINVGPGLMAAYYVGKPISSDLSVEREIIGRLLGDQK